MSLSLVSKIFDIELPQSKRKDLKKYEGMFNRF